MLQHFSSKLHPYIIILDKIFLVQKKYCSLMSRPKFMDWHTFSDGYRSATHMPSRLHRYDLPPGTYPGSKVRKTQMQQDYIRMYSFQSDDVIITLIKMLTFINDFSLSEKKVLWLIFQSATQMFQLFLFRFFFLCFRFSVKSSFPYIVYDLNQSLLVYMQIIYSNTQ